MTYEITGVGTLTLDTIILDLNGTLSVNGSIVDGVEEPLRKLKEMGFRIILFTGDQRGTAEGICSTLGIEFEKAGSSKAKKKLATELNRETIVSIGNARIDIGTFEKAALSIATLQAEGIHTGIIEHVDIIVPSIVEALNLLIDSNTLGATMRK